MLWLLLFNPVLSISFFQSISDIKLIPSFSDAFLECLLQLKIKLVIFQMFRIKFIFEILVDNACFYSKDLYLFFVLELLF